MVPPPSRKPWGSSNGRQCPCSKKPSRHPVGGGRSSSSSSSFQAPVPKCLRHFQEALSQLRARGSSTAQRAAHWQPGRGTGQLLDEACCARPPPQALSQREAEIMQALWHWNHYSFADLSDGALAFLIRQHWFILRLPPQHIVCCQLCPHQPNSRRSLDFRDEQRRMQAGIEARKKRRVSSRLVGMACFRQRGYTCLGWRRGK